MGATRTQQKIERIHQRLMDLRDSTPSRRGHIVAGKKYVAVYLKAYNTNHLTEFYAAAERYRHFLQDGAAPARARKEKGK